MRTLLIAALLLALKLQLTYGQGELNKQAYAIFREPDVPPGHIPPEISTPRTIPLWTFSRMRAGEMSCVDRNWRGNVRRRSCLGEMSRGNIMSRGMPYTNIHSFIHSFIISTRWTEWMAEILVSFAELLCLCAQLSGQSDQMLIAPKRLKPPISKLTRTFPGLSRHDHLKVFEKGGGHGHLTP